MRSKQKEQAVRPSVAQEMGLSELTAAFLPDYPLPDALSLGRLIRVEARRRSRASALIPAAPPRGGRA